MKKSYVVSISGGDSRKDRKEIHDIVREPGDVRLFFKDYSQLFVPSSTLAQISSAVLAHARRGKVRGNQSDQTDSGRFSSSGRAGREEE